MVFQVLLKHEMDLDTFFICIEMNNDLSLVLPVLDCIDINN